MFSITDLAISVFITWGIGLSPALVVRYVIVNRPLKPSTATWVAAVSCIIFWLSFRILLALISGEEPESGFAWVLVFIVSRWIMSKGYNTELVKKIEERLSDQNISTEEREKLQNAKARFDK